MKVKNAIRKVVMQENVNFLLTNRLPRRLVTRLVGRVSRVRNPLVRETGIALWRLFGDLDLRDSQRKRFRSIQDCFTRELRPGARPVDDDPSIVVSPCDAIVGSCGRVEQGVALQVKGSPYTLSELFGGAEKIAPFADGTYVTLRLTSGMYHRFHAPYDLRLRRVTYISGDTWNVNPIALERIERLFCRNERAVLDCELPDGTPIALVPVAAILVASIRLHALDVRLHLKYRGPNEIPCDVRYGKGAEIGWFEHGSTIIVFAPPGLSLADGIEPGSRVRMGVPLLKRG